MQVYKGSVAREYSDFSESEPLHPKRSHPRHMPGASPGSGNNIPSRVHRRKKLHVPMASRNGHHNKLPSWMNSRTSSLNYSNVTSRSSLSRNLQSGEGSLSALDKLNAAAKRVDRMLMELAVADNYPDRKGGRFPTRRSKNHSLSASISVQSLSFPDSARRLENGLGGGREMSSANQTDYDNAESVHSELDEARSDSEMAISTSKWVERAG